MTAQPDVEGDHTCDDGRNGNAAGQGTERKKIKSKDSGDLADAG